MLAALMKLHKGYSSPFVYNEEKCIFLDNKMQFIHIQLPVKNVSHIKYVTKINQIEMKKNDSHRQTVR